MTQKYFSSTFLDFVAIVPGNYQKAHFFTLFPSKSQNDISETSGTLRSFRMLNFVHS